MVIDYRFLLMHREERLQIRGLVEEDVTAAYADWLNDEGNRSGLWIDSGQVITVESQREYIRQIVASEERAITGLFDEEGELIGTTGWHHVNNEHRHPSIGILIGNPRYRGRGLGAILVWANTSMLMTEFGAVKVVAGTLGANRPSLRSFLKAGYRVEGTLRNEVFRSGKGWCDLIVLGCLSEDLLGADGLALAEVRLESSGRHRQESSK